MENGGLDMAVLNQSLIPPQLHSSRFLTDGFCVIARKNHPRIQEKLSMDSFCSLPHVMVSPRTGSFTAQTDEALKKMGLQRFVQLSVPYFTLAAEAVAASDMIAVYPKRLAALADARLRVCEAPLALPTFTLKACWHERAHNDAAHRWLRGVLAACLK